MIERKGFLKADFHGHTFWSSEGMSWYGIDTVLEKALKTGLDVVAITEHSHPLSFLALKYNLVGRTLKRREDKGIKSPLVILGQEVSAREGNTFPHVLILGHDLQAQRIQGVPSLKSVEETIKIAHDLGLLAIAAHPTEEATFASLSYQKVLEVAEKMDSAWDGIETASLRRGKDLRALEIAERLCLPAFGGSDFHRPPEIGQAGTYLPREARLFSSKEVIDFLRTKPELETYVSQGILPPSRNLLLWLRNIVNNKNGR